MSKRFDKIIDTMIAETLLSDPRIKKTAQEASESSIFNKVQEYFKGKLENVESSEDKLAVISEFLAPGIITMIGGPVAGIIFKVLEGIFGFNIGKIFSDIVSSIKNLVMSHANISSGEAQDVVSSAVNSNMPPDPTEDMAEQFKKFNASKLNWREAQLVKVALDEYILDNQDIDFVNQEMNIKFAAGFISSTLGKLFSIKNTGAKVLISVLGWIVEAALISAGFMVAGDAIKHVEKKLESGSPSAQDNSVPLNVSTQKVFKVNPNYQESYSNTGSREWIVGVNPNVMPDVLIGWAKEIYPDLAGHESQIRQSSRFNAVVNVIKKDNAGESGNMTFMPHGWKSTKQVVDQFIDDVAANTNSNTSTIPNATIPTKKPSTVL